MYIQFMHNIPLSLMSDDNILHFKIFTDSNNKVYILLYISNYYTTIKDLVINLIILLILFHFLLLLVNI